MTHQALFQQALSTHKAGQLAQAERLYQQIIHQLPGHFDAFHHLGILYFQMQRYQESIQHILKAIELNPTQPHFYHNLANSFRKMGLFEQAIQGYQKAIHLQPNYFDAMLSLGMVYESIQSLEMAETTFLNCLTINPIHLNTLKKLSELYEHMGQSQKAVDFLSGVIDTHPRAWQVQSVLVDRLIHDNRFPEAIEVCQKGLQFHEHQIPFLWNLGVIHQRLSQLDEAKKYYQKVLKHKSNHGGALLHLGMILFKQNKPIEALTYFNQALQLNPQSDAIKGYIGESYYLAEQYEESWKAMESVCLLKYPVKQPLYEPLGLDSLFDPLKNYHDYLLSNAFYAMSRGNFLTAVDLFKRIAHEAPTHPVVNGWFKAIQNDLRIAL